MDSNFRHLLAKASSHTHSAQALYLARARLSAEQCEQLVDAILENGVCEKLSLLFCDITPSAAPAFARLLEKSASLRHLDLSNNRLHDAGAQQLCVAAAANSQLHSLVLNANHIGDQGAIACSALLQQHANLHYLGLAKNAIFATGCKALGASLHAQSACRRLDLSGNHFGRQGVSELIDGLKRSTITHLQLDNCRLDTRAGKCLFRGLIDTSVQSLSVAMNYFTDAAKKAVAELIINSKTLQFLDCRQNSFTPACVGYLLHALEKNAVLERIDFRGNQLTQQQTAQLHDLVASNKSNNQLFSRLQNAKASAQPITLSRIMTDLLAMQVLVNRHYPGSDALHTHWLELLKQQFANTPAQQEELSATCQLLVSCYAELQALTTLNCQHLLATCFSEKPYRQAIVTALTKLATLLHEPSLHILAQQRYQYFLQQQLGLSTALPDEARADAIVQCLMQKCADIAADEWIIAAQLEVVDLQLLQHQQSLHFFQLSQWYALYRSRAMLQQLKHAASEQARVALLQKQMMSGNNNLLAKCLGLTQHSNASNDANHQAPSQARSL